MITFLFLPSHRQIPLIWTQLEYSIPSWNDLTCNFSYKTLPVKKSWSFCNFYGLFWYVALALWRDCSCISPFETSCPVLPYLFLSTFLLGCLFPYVRFQFQFPIIRAVPVKNCEIKLETDESVILVAQPAHRIIERGKGVTPWLSPLVVPKKCG